jgi:C-terminal processing protease CtpA/Prc
MVGPGIGLLKIPYFPDPTGLSFARALDAAIADLKVHGCERLIVDLRGNIGGSLGFARLVSYLVPGKIPIGHNLTPSRLRAAYDHRTLPQVPMPATRAELFLALARFAIRDKSLMLLTQGLGPQPFHGHIVVLVNEFTNSAAEMVAGFASENRLATIVGTTTAGNVLGAVNFRLAAGYWIRLPVFGWYTGQERCLEGTGVVPDISIQPDAESLAMGIDRALETAIEILSGKPAHR